MLSFFDADYSAQSGSPQNIGDIVIASFIFAFFGIMFFVGSVRYEMTYDKEAKWWKLCFVLIGFGVLFGIQRVAFLSNFLYANTVITKKLLWAHYLALIVPILSGASIFFYKWRKQQSEEKRVY